MEFMSEQDRSLEGGLSRELIFPPELIIAIEALQKRIKENTAEL